MRPNGSARKVAYPALLGALSLVVVYLGSITPTGSWGVVAVAGLMPCAAVISAGLPAGFLCWAGVSILAFLMVPDKFCVLLYGVLFGLYPMVKALIERLRRRPVEYLLKLVFFNAALTVLYLVMRAAVLASLPQALSVVWALYGAGNVVFLLYDYGLSKLIGAYLARIHRAVR
ncbi:MAG TPA: hypothetical protein IAC84_01895 [Firmicutes bacterium]|nr:hypothetical protein [Bacillota bacterium]